MSNILIINTPVMLSQKQVEYASLDNPTLTWMDFVFTDDQPNANGVGVKADQFDSILKTGALMPLKSAEGGIAPGHDGSVPLGVIATLEQKYNETANKNDILGKAALWSEERPDDIEQIKQAYAAGNQLQISWELLFEQDQTDEAGIRWLQAPIVRAATLVGAPAYQGRTPVLAVAALDESEQREETTEYLSEAAVWTTSYINDLPDSAFLYVEPGGSKDKDGKTTPRSLRHFPYKDANGNVDLPHLKNALSRIPQSSLPSDVQARLSKKAEGILSKHNKSQGQSSTEETPVDLEELQQKLDAALAKITELEASLATATAEATTLRDYKASIEAKEARAALLNARLAAFAESGIQFSEEEVAAKQDAWLKLDDDAFTFLVSEMKGLKTVTAAEEGIKVPGTLPKQTTYTIVEILDGLKKLAVK